MAELRAPEQNRLLGQLANMLRTTEGDIAAPEFLPRGLDVMGLVRQLMLPSAETVEKLSYGDPLFRMPTQSNIPITADREYLAEVLGMAPAVPAASRATTRLSNEAADQLVRAITRNPEATAPQVLEAAGQMLPMSRITTYHGSPSLFREFDPTKVGTGEGAQAYGVGSGYTAEARPVAEEYARILANRDVTNENRLTPHANAKRLVELAGDPKYAADDIRFVLETNPDNPQKELLSDTLSYIESGRYAEPLQTSGYLYKGEIPDEILPSFLDWDKPLSQQSEEVRNALKRRVVNVVPQDKFDMGGNARLRDNRGGEVDPTSSQPWLLEATDASGTKFFGLTQKDVDRMFGAKDAKDLTGEQIYARLTQDQGSQQAASEYLNSIGVRGIRYLDQGSRGEGKGTSNFIPFRPEDYRIQEINDRPVGEFFPGLLDQPAQSVVENPFQTAFTQVSPGDEVAGLTVREYVPNIDSISASLDNYEVLSGIRRVPARAFDAEYLDSLRDRGLDKRTADLSEQIKQSKEINPLIVAVDSKGAYIVEGGHRFDALMTQGRESVPAKVVIDQDDPPTEDFLRSLFE
jgi:uncharacterized ParB-like nuclease family protein